MQAVFPAIVERLNAFHKRLFNDLKGLRGLRFLGCRISHRRCVLLVNL
jgi:hypothetical protein